MAVVRAHDGRAVHVARVAWVVPRGYQRARSLVTMRPSEVPTVPGARRHRAPTPIPAPAAAQLRAALLDAATASRSGRKAGERPPTRHRAPRGTPQSHLRRIPRSSSCPPRGIRPPAFQRFIGR